MIICSEVTDFLQNYYYFDVNIQVPNLGLQNRIYKIIVNFSAPKWSPKGPRPNTSRDRNNTVQLLLTMVNIYTGGNARSMQVINSAKHHSGMEHLCSSVSATGLHIQSKDNSTCAIHCRQLAGLPQAGEILLLACFSLACYNTLPALPYYLPRHATFSNEKSLFPFPRILNTLQGITFWEHQEWFIHHTHPCLCHSSGNASPSEGSFPHCKWPFVFTAQGPLPFILNWYFQSFCCRFTTGFPAADSAVRLWEYTHHDFSTPAFNFWLWQSK